MKSAIRVAIAGLMLLGLWSATATPNTPKHNSPVMVAGGNPMPTCDPSDPGCAPPIPPSR